MHTVVIIIESIITDQYPQKLNILINVLDLILM